jgi:hypothetical protein
MAGMGTGRPLTVKCPKCMRGKHGFPSQEKGVKAILNTPQRGAWRGRKRVLRTLTFVHCHDCGHKWWTTLRPRKAI